MAVILGGVEGPPGVRGMLPSVLIFRTGGPG